MKFSRDKKPLIVDVDGTLIQTDLLVESFLGLLKRNFLYVFLVPFWLLKGKANLKSQIAAHVDIDASLLPYNKAVLAVMEEAKKEKRSVILASASHGKYVASIAQHLDVVDDCLASTDEVNLSGSNKLLALVEKFGEFGFDYMGNAKVDLKVWQKSAKAYVVSNCPALARKANRLEGVEVEVLLKSTNNTLALLKAMRPHQWSKNMLVFAPLLLAHLWMNPASWQMAILAFVCFSLCASSVYLLNDLLDLEADRQHKTKYKRPFASGDASALSGLLLMPLLLGLSFSLAFIYLPVEFIEILFGYYVATTLYSFYLKKKVLVDVFTLAGLYTLRLMAGGAATSVMLSEWLLAFSIFIFLSLAVVKRYAELDGLKALGKEKARGYTVRDMPLLLSFGIGCGLLSVLVLALYINSELVKEMYLHKQNLAFLSPVMLYWVVRMWLVTYRGQMHDDPVVYAVKDKISYAVAALLAVIMWSAL